MVTLCGLKPTGEPISINGYKCTMVASRSGEIDVQVTHARIERPHQLIDLRVVSPHIVDESSLENFRHGIISIPVDNIVQLVNGTLESGLGGEYSDFIEVSHYGRVGKISRKVVMPVVSQYATSTDWNPQPSITQCFTPPPAVSPYGSDIHAKLAASTISTIGLPPVYTSTIEPPPVCISALSTIVPPSECASTPSPVRVRVPPPRHGVQGSFIPSPSFVGVKSGYVFRTAEKGVGYYIDNQQHNVSKRTPPEISNKAPPPGISYKSPPPGIAQRRF